MSRVIAVAIVALASGGCVSADDDSEPPIGVAGTESADYPDIVGVEPTFEESSGLWTFAVTVSSPYDTPERYADGWRVMGADGTVYGVHTLAHDHAAEQPFTRRQSGVQIPPDVREVTVEGRDRINGFGGATLTIELPRPDR
jgi:hypothetical protein